MSWKKYQKSFLAPKQDIYTSCAYNKTILNINHNILDIYNLYFAFLQKVHVNYIYGITTKHNKIKMFVLSILEKEV